MVLSGCLFSQPLCFRVSLSVFSFCFSLFVVGLGLCVLANVMSDGFGGFHADILVMEQ